MNLQAAGIDTPELRESFELCRRTHKDRHPATYLIVELLPAQKRPYFHAVSAFGMVTDNIADESESGDRIVEWCADTMRDLRAMHSTHPLRMALVHAVRMWELNIDVIEEMLATLEHDSRNPTKFTSFTELRRYLRGAGGTFGELVVPLLEPIAAGAEPLMSALGEAMQLADILDDFTIDLPRARCYLPTDDLDQLGLTHTDLTSGKRNSALDTLIELQVRRTRSLLDEGAKATSLLHPSSQPYLRTAIFGLNAHLDEVDRRKSSVLWKEVKLPVPRTLLDPRLFVEKTPQAHSRPRVPGLIARQLHKLRAPSAPKEIPRHIAVIMDGNRRWAIAKGRTPLEGHAAGEKALYELVGTALELGVSHLTLFTFSTRNWKRDDAEVSSLMDLFDHTGHQRLDDFHDRGIRLRWCGRRDRLPAAMRTDFVAAEELTRHNDKLTLTMCIDYGGRAEIVDAAKLLAAEITAGLVDSAQITENDFTRFLYEPDLPDVDLLIRTSGEQRISDFLPWHAAFAEIVFDDVLWPDFDRHHLLRAIAAYAERDRRFGGNSVHGVSRQT